MAFPQTNISVFADGSLEVAEVPAVAPLPVYRHPHDRELVRATPEADPHSTDRNYRGDHSGTVRDRATLAIPEIFQLLPLHVTPLSPAWVDLVCAVNYDLPREQALKIFDASWAFNNGRETPGFDKPRVCGGAILSGYEEGGNLHIYSLLTSQPVPDADHVLSRPWLWYYAVMVAPNGNLSYMTLGDGNGNRIPIKIPIITRLPVYVPLAWLHKLPADFLPSPLWTS